MPKDSSRAKRSRRATSQADAVGSALSPPVPSATAAYPQAPPAPHFFLSPSPTSTASSGLTDATAGSSSEAVLSTTTAETSPEPTSHWTASNADQPASDPFRYHVLKGNNVVWVCSPSYQDGVVAHPGKFKKGSGRKIPRPKNSWILFKNDFVETYKAQWQGPGKYTMTDGITAASERWDEIKASEPQEYRKWEALAKNEKVEHERRFPSYRFKPQRKQDKKDKKGCATATGKVATTKQDRRKEPYSTHRIDVDELSTLGAGSSNSPLLLAASTVADPRTATPPPSDIASHGPSSTETLDHFTGPFQQSAEALAFPLAHQLQQAAMDMGNAEGSFTFLPTENGFYPWLAHVAPDQALPFDLCGAQGEMQVGSSNQPMGEEFVFPGQDPEYAQAQEYGDAQALDYGGFQELNYHYPPEQNQGSHQQHYYEPNVGMMPAEPVFLAEQRVLDASFPANGFNGQYPQEYDVGGAQGF